MAPRCSAECKLAECKLAEMDENDILSNSFFPNRRIAEFTRTAKKQILFFQQTDAKGPFLSVIINQDTLNLTRVTIRSEFSLFFNIVLVAHIFGLLFFTV
jgi:hypothetical protein